jgi:Do/DeqQ family serine protease
MMQDCIGNYDLFLVGRKSFMKRNLNIKNSKMEISSAPHNYPMRMANESLKAFLLIIMLFISFNAQQRAEAQFLTGQNQSQTAQANPATNANSPLAVRASYADVVERVTPAVVTVRAERKAAAQTQELPFSNDPLLREFFGRELPQMRQTPQIQRGMGSGVIVESNGTILTNNHVVNGSSRVRVELSDRRTFDAKVVGTDPASDLAVLKIEAGNLPTLPLGDSDRVRVGDVVLAIGNPLGLQQTVTSGIISAKGRQTGISDGSFEDFLQTDAPINQGNSGGALVNLNGELIGINSQILSTSGGSIGLGFSIPSNMAKSVMTQLVKDGRVRRGQLGVGIQNVTSDLAGSFGLKDVRGVIVTSVSPNSPSERAGIKQGDVIVSFNGVNVSDGNDLRNRVAQTAPNSPVTVGIVRDGRTQTVNVTLGEFQPKADASFGNGGSSNAEPLPGKLGLTLEPMTPQMAQRFNLKDALNGLVVTGVQGASAADEAGIQPGDVILQVNRQDVKTVDEVSSVTAKAQGKSVLLLINRGGQNLFVTVQM